MQRILMVLVVCSMVSLPTMSFAGTMADPSDFVRRLASIGLSTDYVQKVLSRLEIYYRTPSSTAEAEWGYMLDNLYIPWDQKAADSSNIRFDLETPQINTLIHELCHASSDLCASESAAAGTPDRAHADLLHVIRADIYVDPRHQVLGLARYPGVKADEIVAYYVGNSVQYVFEGVDDIVSFNVGFCKAYIHTAEDAERLGTTLVLPPVEGPGASGWSSRVARRRYGDHRAGNEAASFENKPIPWDERPWVKDEMFDFSLGLNLPHTAAELVDRLNTVDNDWIRDVRARVAAARRARAAELRPMAGLSLLGAGTSD